MYSIYMKLENIMVIAPHPDDETIGAGGLISKVNRLGGKVTIVCVTCPTDERHEELLQAIEILGGGDLRILTKHPTRWIDDLPLVDLVRPLEQLIATRKPTTLLLPSPSSFHQEHRTTGFAVLASTRPSGATGRHRPNTVAYYEEIPDYWSTDRSVPLINCYVELSKEDINNKTNAMVAHKSQDRPVPSERSADSLHALAVVRGAQAGFHYAEGYEVRMWRS